jgi:hypothetical protein
MYENLPIEKENMQSKYKYPLSVTFSVTFSVLGALNPFPKKNQHSVLYRYMGLEQSMVMALGDTEISFSAKIRHRNNLRTRKIRLDLKYKKMSPLILNITGLLLEKCSYAPDIGRPDYHNIIE